MKGTLNIMSDVAKSKELLKRYSIARIPFIAVNTIERARTLDILKEIAEDVALHLKSEKIAFKIRKNQSV